MSFGRSLIRNVLFPVPRLSFLFLGFVVWGIVLGSHSLMPLVITTIGIFYTNPIFVCVGSDELCYDGCHGSCHYGLKSSDVYLQDWCFAGWPLVSW